MDTIKQKAVKKPSKIKESKAKTPKFLKHSVLVEQELMSCHEYERIYYKPSLV
jgi:hypothetical protein